MTDPRSPREWELLFDRYLAGELSRAEETELLRGLAGRGEDRWAVDALRACRDRATAATFRTIGELSVTDDRAADLEGVVRLERALRLSEAPIDPPATRPRALSFRHPGGTGRARDTWPQGVGESARWAWRVGTVAAAIVVVVGVVGLWRSGVRDSAGQQFREFASALGGRTSVTLRDGTRLVLGPGTRLLVPSDFGHTDRRVELDGEALFTVVHDARHPFAVHTARALIRDVGTTFVVRAYADDKTDRVAVQEGRVSLVATTEARGRSTTAHAALSAGDVGMVADTSVVVAHHADVAPYVAWVQGGLSFDNTPLRDAVRDVARAFSLEITLADSSLGAKPITSTFGDEPADEVLDAITRVVGARYERSGRTVVIRRGPVRSHGGTQGLRLPISTAQNSAPRE